MIVAGAGDVAPLNLDYLRLRAEQASKKILLFKIEKDQQQQKYLLLKIIFKKNFALATLGGGGAPSPKSASLYRLAFKQTLYAKI